MTTLKALVFRGDSKRRFLEFPEEVKDIAGYELFLLQNGREPSDFKPMPSIGPGVEELRVRDSRSAALRVIYIARLAGAVYVLHAFQKQTQKTAIKDLDLARQRLRDLMKEQ